MWKKVLLGVAVVIALFLVFVQTRPSEFHIERSLAMNAPQARAFELINDFHHWSAWSPWDKLDPGMKREFSGPASGAGAAYSWSGNNEVGSGRMTINESLAPEQIKIALDFLTPFEAHNVTTFSIRSSGAGSTVTWMMDGEHNFVSKGMCLFMDMDKMVGKDFEAGLQNMKQIAEGAPPSAAAAVAP